MPYYRFTGKELDPETGLYYYGARYYDAVLSRWISADPMVVKYLPSTGSEQLAAGGVYRPINLNTYHYASNNPLLFVDPDGLWGENIHLAATEKWAKAGGFSPEQAKKIAEATNFVDSFWSGKSWMPVFGDQGYHFNTNAKGEDSRLERAEYHLKRAIEYQKAANKLRNKDTGFFGSIIGWFKNLLANMYEKEALKELGTGLHPLEDVDAHTNEYGEQLVYKKFGIYYHNDPKNPLSRGKENRADNPEHDPERLQRTEQRVSDYFQRFWKGVAGE